MYNCTHLLLLLSQQGSIILEEDSTLFIKRGETCKNCFGYLPLMMGASKCQLGAVNSESYSERINSAANQVVTKNVVSTDPDFVDKLVTLRMNEKFMAHVLKFKYKGKTNLIPDIENVIKKSSNNLWMDDESLFEELIMKF